MWTKHENIQVFAIFCMEEIQRFLSNLVRLVVGLLINLTHSDKSVILVPDRSLTMLGLSQFNNPKQYETLNWLLHWSRARQWWICTSNDINGFSYYSVRFMQLCLFCRAWEVFLAYLVRGVSNYFTKYTESSK